MVNTVYVSTKYIFNEGYLNKLEIREDNFMQVTFSCDQCEYKLEDNFMQARYCDQCEYESERSFEKAY